MENEDAEKIETPDYLDNLNFNNMQVLPNFDDLPIDAELQALTNMDNLAFVEPVPHPRPRFGPALKEIYLNNGDHIILLPSPIAPLYSVQRCKAGEMGFEPVSDFYESLSDANAVFEQYVNGNFFIFND